MVLSRSLSRFGWSAPCGLILLAASALAGDVFTISGSVAEFPVCGGAMRGVRVRLEPLGWETRTAVQPDGGSFEFPAVPPGEYVLSIVDGCNPFGCWVDTPVEVVDADVGAQICMAEVPTPTAVPPVPATCPHPTPRLCSFGHRSRCSLSPGCLVACVCERCPPCTEGQTYSGEVNRCDCVAGESLPDLVPERAIVDSSPVPECVDDPNEYITLNLPIEICIRNHGGAAAGPFTIAAGIPSTEGERLRVPGVGAWGRRCIDDSWPVDVPGPIAVEVDVDDEVVERDEGNNAELLDLLLPEQPPMCRVRVEIPWVSAAPGELAEFSVFLGTGGEAIASVEHDIGFPPEAPVVAQPSGPPNGSPDCALEGGLAGVDGSFTFGPEGCAAGIDCEHVRVSVSAVEALPEGLLYSCRVAVPFEFAAGCFFDLTCSGLAVRDTTGVEREADCRSGTIHSRYERFPVSFTFDIEPDRPVVGDHIVLTVGASGVGYAPTYYLTGAEPFFAGDTSPIGGYQVHEIAYELEAVRSGSASLTVSVVHEIDIGCPGSNVFQFVSDTSEPFAVEIAGDSTTPTLTPTETPPACPTTTPCMIGDRPAPCPGPCVFACGCEPCPPCPPGQVRGETYNRCTCVADAGSTPTPTSTPTSVPTGTATPTETPTVCPQRTPCPAGEEPRPCDEPCGLGCGCVEGDDDEGDSDGGGSCAIGNSDGAAASLLVLLLPPASLVWRRRAARRCRKGTAAAKREERWRRSPGLP